MFFQFTTILLLVTSISSLDDQNPWNFKFSFTKQINSQLSIDCGEHDQIWIGWSHYGTRKLSTAKQQTSSSEEINQQKNRTSQLSQGIRLLDEFH